MKKILKKKTYWADFCLLLLLLFPLLVSCAKYETVSSQKDFDSEFDKSINLQEKESFYYYYGEKIPVEQHADMLFIQFSSKEHKESYKRKLTSVSSLQLYSSNANNFQQDDESSFLVAYSTIGNLSSKQLSEIEYEDGVQGVSFICGDPGNTFTVSIPNTTVPDGSRRKLYIRLYDSQN